MDHSIKSYFIFKTTRLVRRLGAPVKTTDKTVVEMMVQPQHKNWLVWWVIEPPYKIWKRYENLKNVAAFQHYCATNKLELNLPS
jgi:hypothetical protein